jgi:flagellar FliL protein
VAEGRKGNEREGRGKGGKGGRSGKLKLLVPVVLLLGAGLAAKSLLLGSPAQKAEAKPKKQEGAIVTMDPVTVNLADAGFHYARVGFGIVLTTTASSKEVEERLPLFKDQAISTVGGFQSRVLKTVEGQDELRHRLTEVAFELYGEEEIVKVILTEIVVQ